SFSSGDCGWGLPCSPLRWSAGSWRCAISESMRADPLRFLIFVLAARVAVLGSALLAQYWGGLAPCDLCLLQRWPWGIAIAISLIAIVLGSRPALPWVALVLAAVFVVGGALAFYHAGVERHWFAGP